MFRNLFFAALVAALCAGLVVSAIQHFRVIPLILYAETFEDGHDHDDAAVTHDHGEDAEEWVPQDGFERAAYTVLANLLVAAGFALIIGAVSMFAGISITTANGWLWGLAGFASFTLAPAYGLAPELPGMPAANLAARQLWWIGAALATGAAILLLAKIRAAWAIAVAIALIIVPHIIGAPLVPEHHNDVPARLAAQFAVNTIGTATIFWLVLGTVLGWAGDWLAVRSFTTPTGEQA